MTLKYFLFFCFFTLSCHLLKSQNFKSLKNKLNSSENKKQVNIRNEIANLFLKSNPNKGILYAKEADELAKKINYQIGRAEANALLGNLQIIGKGRADLAAKHHRLAYDLYKRLYETKKIPQATFEGFINNNIARVYKYITNNKVKRKSKALKIYQPLYIEINDYLTQKIHKTEQKLDLTEEKLNLTKHKLNLAEKALYSEISNQKQHILEKIKLSGILSDKELEILALGDSLLQKELQLKSKTLKKVKQKVKKQKQDVKREKLQKEKALDKVRIIESKVLYEQQKAFIYIFIFIIIISGVIYFNYLNQKKINQKLAKKTTELEGLNQELEGLIDIVAHDLKSPLNKIRGLVEIINLTGGLGKEQKEYVKLIEKSYIEGENLIQDMLDVSNIGGKDDEIELKEVELGDFLEEFIKIYYQIAEQKGIILHFEVKKEQNLLLKTEENYLRRVLDNLLSNAIKFSYENSNIWFKVHKEANDIIFSIKDEGQGMTEEDKKKIFKKFQKLSAKPTAGESSNGLGLSIVKALIDKLNGNIEVKTEQDKGTEFIVCLA